MYSGSTLTKTSGRILGAHQKFDKVARKHLAKIADGHAQFPTARKILHFEGKNGPDALKRKSPAKDEPWHYYSPFDDQDSILVKLIEDHYKQLVRELKQGNDERVAFEAAWLAHALVDGLTPAHHYPYEKKLVELRGGEGIETRTSIKAKWIIPGINRREKVKNNFKMWGPKGLITTHGLFELGIATIIAPLTFKEAVPSEHDIARMMDIGVIAWFQAAAREIAVMDMYGAYYKRGWTPKLAWLVRHKLGTVITQTITLTWYSALVEAGAIPRPKALQTA